jgi:hypothetical protein
LKQMTYRYQRVSLKLDVVICFPPMCANLLLKIGSTDLIYIKYNLQTLNGYRKTIMSLFFYIGLGPRL